jgi:hypothetical protein
MKTYRLRRSSLSLVLLLLAGCATRQLVSFPDPQAAVQDPRKSRIYVMRDPNFWRFNLVSLFRKIRVLDGAVEIGSIAGQRGCLSWEREPGDASLSVPGEAYLGLTVEKGSAYYVVVHDKAVGAGWPPGSGRMIVELELVDAEKGRRVLARGTPPDHPE